MTPDEALHAYHSSLRYFAWRYASRTLPATDLYQEGVCALLALLPQLDPQRPLPAQRAFVKRRLRGAMVDAQRTMHPGSRATPSGVRPNGMPGLRETEDDYYYIREDEAKSGVPNDADLGQAYAVRWVGAAHETPRPHTAHLFDLPILAATWQTFSPQRQFLLTHYFCAQETLQAISRQTHTTPSNCSRMLATATRALRRAVDAYHARKESEAHMTPPLWFTQFREAFETRVPATEVCTVDSGTYDVTRTLQHTPGLRITEEWRELRTQTLQTRVILDLEDGAFVDIPPWLLERQIGMVIEALDAHRAAQQGRGAPVPTPDPTASATPRFGHHPRQTS